MFRLFTEQKNRYCVSAAPFLTFILNLSEDCSVLFSQDDTWYRACVLE